jgi:hypothetical protein
MDLKDFHPGSLGVFALYFHIVSVRALGKGHFGVVVEAVDTSGNVIAVKLNKHEFCE